MDAQVTRIGCKRDARKALQGLLEPVRKVALDGNMLPARGASRAAFMSPDRKVVYKVCHNIWMGRTIGDDNRIEAEQVAKARKSPVGQAYVMPTTMWIIDGIPVNAQPALVMTGDEYRRSDPDAFWMAQGEIGDAADELGVRDMHDGNWGIDADGRAWIIDCNVSHVASRVTAPAQTAATFSDLLTGSLA